MEILIQKLYHNKMQKLLIAQDLCRGICRLYRDDGNQGNAK